MVVGFLKGKRNVEMGHISIRPFVTPDPTGTPSSNKKNWSLLEALLPGSADHTARFYVRYSRTYTTSPTAYPLPAMRNPVLTQTSWRANAIIRQRLDAFLVC